MSVTERPDDYEVSRPLKPHNLITPFEFLSSEPSLGKSALLLLNQPYDIDIPKLWVNTQLHVCADGAANNLYDYFDSDEERTKYIPQFIVGDLDSLDDKARDYYRSKGTKVIRQSTQYSTDFSKSLLTIELYFHSAETRALLTEDVEPVNGLSEIYELLNIDPLKEEEIRIFALSGIGGRFDQTIQSISQLFKLDESSPYLLIYFITNTDVIFLVKKGLNFVTYTNKSVFNKKKVPICGLLPLGRPTVLNTLGLKYDVTNWPSEMLGDVSSSNGICGIEGFVVETTETIVMNVELHK